MKLLKKKVPALFLILLVVLSLTVPALAASSTDTAVSYTHLTLPTICSV